MARSLTAAKETTAPENASAAEWVPIGSIHPWPGNPRKNADAVPELVKSIETFGFAAPIVARMANREIIAGHTRWKAAKKLGLDRVPVRFVDLDERQAHALALRDNKLGELAEWDDEALQFALAQADEETVALFDEETPGGREDLVVEELDVSDAVAARFWMTVSGPVPKQPDAIEALRKSLESLGDVDVQIGVSE